MAITSGSLYLAHLRDEIEAGRADEAGGQFFRLAVNLNKYRSSISATDVIRRGIEILGGNGAMENFSVLPRLLRDSVIFEAWEGAHNTLLAQSVRDIQQRKLHEGACAKLAALFGELELDDLNKIRSQGVFLVESLREIFDSIQRGDAHTASASIRFAVDRMMYLFYVACLGREAQWEERQRGATDKLAVIDWLWDNRIITRSITAEYYLQRIAEISATL
jgi:hypothetical protein